MNTLKQRPGSVRMRTRTIMIYCLGVASGIATTLALAQAALDPVRVAPHIYEVALQNDRVRVLRATIRNGETAPLHAHPDRVRVHLSPCAWLVEEDGGATRMESLKFGEVLWEEAVTHGGETSNVIQECRVLEIELR